MFQQLNSWLSYFLNSSCLAYDAFISYTIPGITLTTTCPALVLDDVLITQNGNLLSTTTQGSTYQWYLNNQPVLGATNDSLTIDVNFSGVYNLLVAYDYGCAFSNNIAGLEENLGVYQIFPNPANEKLFISGLSPKSVTFMLHDMQGQTVLSGQIQNGNAEINLEQLKNGSYLLQLVAEPSTFCKVIIAH